MRTASRQRGRRASAAVWWGMAGPGPGVLSAARSMRRGGRGLGSCMASVGSRGVSLVLGRTAGKGCTGGILFALVATVCTGRRSNSETIATATGVIAALISVPVPQIRDAPYAAAADAMLAMISVCSETPLLRRVSLRSGSRSGDTTSQPSPAHAHQSPQAPNAPSAAAVRAPGSGQRRRRARQIIELLLADDATARGVRWLLASDHARLLAAVRARR